MQSSLGDGKPIQVDSKLAIAVQLANCVCNAALSAKLNVLS